MRVETDHVQKQVVLRGNAFEIRLRWSEAMLLADLLQDAAEAIEPPTPIGRTYCPTVERDRR